MSEKPWQVLFYTLIICVLILICGTFLDYGLTWDEDLRAGYGVSVLKWYLSFFQDHAAIQNAIQNIHGGFFDAMASGIAYSAWKIFNIGFYETRHLVNALVGLAAIVGTYKLGSLLSGSMGGLFSALFLTLTPVFYGHLFNNPKDIPFATLFVISFYYLLLSYNALPCVSKDLLIRLGTVMGLTLGVRIGGILLVVYLLILWTGWLAAQYVVNGRQTRPPILTFISYMSRSFSVTIILAWAIMLVWWPWAQVSPLLHPLEALRGVAHFPWHGQVFFNGRFLAATELPWSYLPTWFGISLPEFYFIAFFIGGFLALKFIINFRRAPAHFEWLMKIGLLVVGACFSILIAIIMHSVIYDGMRHFLFVLPILAVLAGISFAGLLRSDVSPLVKGSAGVLIGLSAGITVFDMVQLHPYESVYFNRAVAGGLEAAASQFETDYWGNSYKEGAEWVIENYHPPFQGTIRVANCARLFQTSYFFEKTEDLQNRFVAVQREDNPHIFLATTRWECHKTIKGNVLHTVERQGVPLLYVIEVGAREE
jgi:hypothetical protein